ncbi:hypothetical protein N9W89_11045 [Hellea sp.]|nr:hypothetical protein [Hellea sp.]
MGSYSPNWILAEQLKIAVKEGRSKSGTLSLNADKTPKIRSKTS